MDLGERSVDVVDRAEDECRDNGVERCFVEGKRLGRRLDERDGKRESRGPSACALQHAGRGLGDDELVDGLRAARGSGAPETAPSVIWAGSAQKPSLEKSAAAWGKAPVVVYVHEASTLRNDLAGTSPANAPDLIVGNDDWLGDLVPSGVLLPLY